MATKAVQFTVEIENLVITSGSFQVRGIVGAYVGGAVNSSYFSGNTFSVNLADGQSEYFSVTVLVQEYKIGDVTYTVQSNPVGLLAVFYLPDTNYTVKITPGSTVASIYTFARMTTVGDDGWVNMSGSMRNMKIAYGMKQNIYLAQGGIADMIQQSPNGFETNSYPMFNSLCNLFYYCMTDTAFYSKFLDYAYHETDKPNQNFLQAVRNMLYDPFTKAREIYEMLADKPEVYKNSLTTIQNVPDDRKAPNNWTLTLKSNKSGAKNFIPSGAAFVVFDADDNAWIANNFRAGAGDSGTHCPVYKYDATPADFSPVQGGGLLGVGFGAAIDPNKEYISFGNFGWGSEYNNPQEGGIARFYKDGRPVTPSNGFTPGLSRVQGMDYDTAGNLWMASVGCQEPFAPAPVGVYPFTSEPSAVVVYMNQDPEKTPDAGKVLICDEFPVKHAYESDAVLMRTPYLKVFDVTPDNRGNAFVSCIGNYDKDDANKCILSAVYKVAIENNKLVVKASWYGDSINKFNGQKGYESLRQVAINGNGDAVVVAVASSRAVVLDKDSLDYKTEYKIQTFAPWGVKIDKKQTVYLANFGHESEPVSENTLDGEGPFGVTMLRNADKPDTARLLTVPTGGAEVTLANGHPLYGTQTKPAAPGSDLEPVRMVCYQPIMRLTSTNIDGAGNLWCMNNWKPSAVVDAVLANPGGDGVVIFLGIAEPE